MDKKYRVVAVPVTEKPFEAQMTFEEIKKFVGSDVEVMHMYDKIHILIDEDARFKATSKVNRTVVIQERTPIPITILNNFVMVKQGKEDFTDMTDEDVKEALFIFRSTSQDATIFI